MIAALLVVFAFVGCSDSSDSPPSYSAPKVKSAVDLPASDATVGTQEESKEIFLDALEALSLNVNDFANSPSMGSIRKARYSESFPIEFTEALGGGTITAKGKMTIKYSEPDENREPKLNKWYNNIVSAVMTGNIDTTVKNCAVPVDGETYTYTMDGESKEQMYVDMNVDVYFSDTDLDMNMDIYASVAYGASYSLKRSDTEKGGKFVLTYATTFEKNDLALFDIDVDPDLLYGEMAGKKAQLKVYDDSNALQYTINIPLDELPSVITSFMDE